MRTLALPAAFVGLCLHLVTASAVAGGYTLETVASALHHPWSVVRLPGGDFLVTERRGRLLRIPAGGGKATALEGVPETFVAGQGGFFALALHPDFSSNRLLYLSYAEGPPGNNGTAVWRARLGPAGLEEGRAILRVEDRKDTPQHYGGPLLFLPDGSLLLATGDGFDYREQAQHLDSELGKVLRVSDTGDVPANNPWPQGERPRIWTLGHRNPQGLALNTVTGEVYLHEHGPRGGDELNRLRPGSNYGWPVITYGVDYSGAYVSPFTHHPGMEQPLHHWTPSIAPSGMAWYNGEQFPQWRGDLFIGALVDREVRRLELEQGEVVNEEGLFSEVGERIRAVYSADDGLLYLLTDSEAGRLIRVRPATAGTADARGG